MLNRSDIEVMSPAGSFESLMAAIQGGANAVYFGIGHLNMRAKSSANFTLNDLKEIVKICHENNVKSYLTVNTVLYDNDLPAVKELLKVAKVAGVSAIIASDQAALMSAFELGHEIHLSTQLNISNLESLKFYAHWADVVVLARELSLEQIHEIYQGIERDNITGPSGKKIKIELFVHGALCMAISGKCHLSLHQENISANRGACLQICRRSYTVQESETGKQLEVDNEYIMSPKDLCTINFLNKVIDAGVRVLKIEGRARAPEYVKTVTQCYNEAVNAICTDTYSEEKVEDWMTRLSSVFNRGFWDGYYLGRKLGEWSHVYGSVATERKIYCGKITNYFSNLGVAEILIEAHELLLNDKFLIIGPTTGVLEGEVTELRVDEKPAEHCPKGTRCSIPMSTMVRRSDKLYRVISEEELHKMQKNRNSRNF
jgi:U32 family peptidase